MSQSRRGFVATVAGSLSLFVARQARASRQVTQTFSGPMQQNAYLPVKLAARTGAVPSMTDLQRDDLEHQIKCQCGCPLDVFTCRTTDFSCSVSPAMHADIMGLVTGGYSATEILSAFQKVYGERVLMSPIKSGFNWLGYVTPSIAIAIGAVAIYSLIRRWGARAAARPASVAVQTDATPAELDAINAALRDDG
jgi:cytochrome c-type biogenesis protein CcmH